MNIRHALKSLRRAPGFSLAAILTLVLGIGAVGAMFAIVYGVLLAPLPYGKPGALVSIGLRGAEIPRIAQAPGMYFTYERFAKRLDGIALYRTGSTNLRMSDGSGAAESVVATWVTASMVPLLQIPPLLGRAFNADEESRGGSNAVILSEPEWRNRFASARDVIGKTLIVNDAPRTVVGVMPARFTFPSSATRVWLPVKHTDSATVADFYYSGIARLAPGATPELAQLELAAALPRMAELYPNLQSGGSTTAWLTEVRATPVVIPLREELTGEIAGTLWMLAAAAGMVLLVAWANVANLMLVHSESCQQELAVRSTLGAGSFRIATQFLGESILLGVTAGLLALLLTYAAVKALVAFGPADVPRLAELAVGPMTIAFITLVTILGVIICASVPMLHVRRGNLAGQLHDGARGQSTGKSRQRVRAGITVVQIAVALVVSVGSLLLLRSAQQLFAVQPGFDATEVTTLRVLLPFARYSGAANVAFYARLTELVNQLPSVHAAGLTMKVPLAEGALLEQTFSVEGQGRTLLLPVNVIGNGYFAALRIPLLAGRDFRPLDVAQNSDIIISQRAAAAVFGGANRSAAVGKWLKLAPNGPIYTIVGVAGDVRDQDLATAPSAMIYRPQAVPKDANVEPVARPSMALVVRSSGPPDAVVSAIRQIVRGLDPTVPIFDVQSMHNLVRASTARLSLAVTLMTTAAVITLMIGGIGLYGVMAYIVALRTREFGVRVALGADPRRIARMVLVRGLALTACGLALGMGLYTIVAPFLRAFLYGVKVSDPLTLIAATVVVATIAALASWLPARRAALLEPVAALRAD